MTGPSDNDSA